MELTLNSKIGDLIVAIGEVIKNSDGNSATVELGIPDESFYLEITVKHRQEAE